ncbi:IS30 family transposase [Lacticaseibacillus daqingensis]|uniref:IS30 family transposase n=1 Tax=Lacticaseibacillus daqingensis TaxID=2486014 RepID=UPI000F76BEB2|nr:IS30 family transposase [Lacticaseibacillus daqingensis]
MTFKHLSEAERGKIELLWNDGKTQADIARILHRNRSTISREILRSQEFQDYKMLRPRQRQRILRYNAMIAETNARSRSTKIGRKCFVTTKMVEIIAEGYSHHWSPDQIVHGNVEITVCRNTVYNWIFRGWVPKVGHDQIKRYHRRPKRRKEALTEAKRKMIKDRSIDNRSEVINNRERFGDWELDCVLPSRDGKKVIVTFNERLTRLTFAAFAKAQTGKALVPVIDTFMSLYGNHVLSLTCDHGAEFANTTLIGRIEDTYHKKLYFAHSYAPEERGTNGTNENSNGLIRAFLPKKQTFEGKTQSDMINITKELNTRPRKMHDWKTCEEIFNNEIQKAEIV